MKIKLDILHEIGLTRKEAELYTALLKLGESPVADLINQTKTHPQIVYSTLKSLTEKGLVITSYQRHRRYIRAEQPQQLNTLEKQRLKQLDELIPALVSLQSPPEEATVRVYKGNTAVRDDREKAVEVLSNGEILFILGGGAQGKFIKIMRDQHVELERRRVNKGVVKKMLAYVNQRDLIEQTNIIKTLTETRYLPENYATPTSLFIYGPFSSTVIWLPEPIVITVENKEVADGNRNYFNSLWHIAQV